MSKDLHYINIHKWMKRHGPKKEGKCTHCGTHESGRFEWALLHGKEYDKKPENFIELCASCHRKYDKNYGHLDNRRAVWAVKDGEIRYFASATNAMNTLGLIKTAINNCLQGRTHTSGGYKWKYA